MLKRGLLGLSAAVLLLAPSAASAQGVQLSAKGGLALMNVSEVEVDGRTGFAAGLGANVGMAGPFSVQAEALYVQKGAEDLETAYLEVPVMFLYPIAMQGAVEPFVGAGPFVGFNLSCDAGGFDCGDDIESLEYGVAFGAGVRFGALRKLSAEVRYDLGLAEISEDSDVKNRGWLLLFGFAF